VESGNTAKKSASKGIQKPDVQKLMQEIRAKVKAAVLAGADQPKSRRIFSASENGQNATAKAGELRYSENLRFLNQNYGYSARIDPAIIVTHRKGIIGKVIVAAKRKALRFIEDLLKGYLSEEREYQANLVRYLNDVSKYVDARDASNFWELIRKIDYDVTKAVEHFERSRDDLQAELSRHGAETVRQATAEVGALKAQSAAIADQVKTLDSVVRGLEGITAQLGRPQGIKEAQVSAKADHKPVENDFSYLLLENRFRGSEDEIKSRVSIYPTFFKGASQKVLEIGAGRGELQTLFKEAGIASYAVDLDRAMVARSAEKGLDVQFGDGIAHLRSLKDGSLGGVIAIQVVEHLTREQLNELCTLCAKKVAKGGKIIFETINPRSLLALSSNYFRDPTHVWPLHPDTLSYAMDLCGLHVKEVKFLSPVPKEAEFRQLEIGEFLTPQMTQSFEQLNRNIAQLNELMYGFQDYCVIAEA
jgi:2-polyprenyl-3-methyl-5-hydroxy-6-metoxy-1,4-benzoquinol methylase